LFFDSLPGDLEFKYKKLRRLFQLGFFEG